MDNLLVYWCPGVGAFCSVISCSYNGGITILCPKSSSHWIHLIKL